MIGKKAPNPKKSSGKSARVGSLTAYITNPELSNGKEKCIHYEAENFITSDLQSQTLEMIALSHEAVRSKDPIDHYVLSWQEGEQPSIQQARETVQTAMKHLGLEGHQVIWGMHSDTDNVHIHIEVNRVHPETFKVVEVNKGFQNNAIQQAAAIIEKVQGWKAHDKARFKTDELGHLITDSKTKLPQVFKDANKAKEPTGPAKDKEIQTGEKSAQRICIEAIPAIVASATSWADLHTKMQAAGMEYRREGSGAKILIGDTAVKASDVVDRKNNFGALQKRFGLYQPANQQEIKNDPHNRTQLIVNTYQPNFAKTGFGTGHNMRDLSSSHLAHSEKSGNGKTRFEGVLQLNVGIDRQRTDRVRRGGHSDGAESQSRQPIIQNQPGWTQYQQIKEANDSAKNAERLELSKRHDFEKAELKAKQKIEREAALKAAPKGNGVALNLIRGVIADKQRPATQELQERHKAEREALRASYKPLPMYNVWKAQPQIVSERIQPLLDQHITRDTQPTHVSQIIKQLTQRRDEHRHFTYALDKKDVFRDEGKIIKILDLKSNAGIAAALATAQQKYGDVLTLTGSDAFKQNAVAVAVEHNLTCRYDDPALEKLRTQFQAQKDAAVREAAQADRERTAAAQLEKTKALTPAPVHFPIQQTREADEPGPSAEHQPQPHLDEPGQRHTADDQDQIQLEMEMEKRKAKADTELQEPGQPDELDMKDLVTDRERELVQRINAAIKANDGPELKLCMEAFGGVRNEAQKALAAVAPQEVNKAAIAHQVKTEQNAAAVKRGNREPWYMSGIGSKTSACAWDTTAAEAATSLADHLKTQRPTGMFKGAEGKAWDERSAQLSGVAADWDKAAEGIKQELASTTGHRVSKEEQAVTAANRQNAPQHAKELERCEALAVVEKRLGTALQPQNERELARENSKGYGR